MPLTANSKGAAIMALAMIGFTVNDVFMKLLLVHVPLAQAVFLRGVGTTLFLIALAAGLGQLRWRLPRGDGGLILLRSAAEVLAAYFFLTALVHMEIGNATAILQSLPLTITLGAALVFKEPVGWRRLTAIAVGFVGVLMIVKPGLAGFNAYALWALAAVACVTVRDLCARRLSPEVPSMMVAVVASAAVTLCFGAVTATRAWVPMPGVAMAQLLGCMLFLMAAYVASVAAMRVGDVGAVAPFRYTALVASMLAGVLVFGDRPDALTLLGAAIIMAAGLFTLARERRLARR